MRKSTRLAVAAMSRLGAGADVVTRNDPGYPVPGRYSPSSRNGNNRREDSAKRHAKTKAAYKSKRAQRKKAKR